MKKVLQITIGLLLSAVFAWLAIRNIQWKEFILTLQSGKYWWYILPSSVLFLASFFSRAIRWGYFLEPIQQVSNQKLYSALMIGYMGNNVLPLRLGELLRAYALNRTTGISKSAGLATIVVERLVDIAGLLLFLIVAVIVSPIPPRYRFITLMIGAVAVLILAVLLLLTFFDQQMTKLLQMIFRFLPEFSMSKITQIVQSFIQGLHGLRQTSNYWKILLHTCIMWVLYASSTYCMLVAFNFNHLYGMDFWAAIVILLIGTVGVLIPSSPGFIGTYEGVMVFALAIYSVPKPSALGFAIVIHLVNYIPVTLIGLYFFLREGLRFREIPDST